MTELLFLEDAGGDPCSRSTAARKASLRVGSSIRARCVLRMAFLLGSSNAMIALQTSLLVLRKKFGADGLHCSPSESSSSAIPIVADRSLGSRVIAKRSRRSSHSCIALARQSCWSTAPPMVLNVVKARDRGRTVAISLLSRSATRPSARALPRNEMRPFVTNRRSEPCAAQASLRDYHKFAFGLHAVEGSNDVLIMSDSFADHIVGISLAHLRQNGIDLSLGLAP